MKAILYMIVTTNLYNMKTWKILSLILLLALTFVSCHNNNSKLTDFNQSVYTHKIINI